LDMLGAHELRLRAVRLARGEVLEIGVGTGKNLGFYPPNCRVTAIDLSPKMLARAKSRAASARAAVTLLEADAQSLPFPDGSFDTVLATFVFCSVPDPVRGLREVKRVCRPGGRIVLLEHVRSPNPVVGAVMDALDPLVSRVIGTHVNRRTAENVRAAGLTIGSDTAVKGPLVRLIVAEP